MAKQSARDRSSSRSSRGRRPSRRGANTAVNVSLIVASAVTGVIAWVLGNFFYSSLAGNIPMPLLIGIIFLSLYLLLAVVVFVSSKAAGFFQGNILTGSGGAGSVLLLLGAAGAVVFGAAVLFQWIYGLAFDKVLAPPTSYVFMIDDSGSMLDNDPRQERYAAISAVLEDVDGDTPYMVYSFADGVELVKDMMPVSSGIPDFFGISDGQTAIRGALTQVIGDWENGVWQGGKSPKVILLTDGYATDDVSGIDTVLDRFTKANISVSTVGLGNADTVLMRHIAERTGGVFVDAADASELSAAMRSAADQTVARDLVSARPDTGMTVLYGILRVVFLTILGVAIGVLMAAAYGFDSSAGIIVISSLIKAPAGALLMELGTAFGMPDTFARLMLLVLFALTIAKKIVSDVRSTDRVVRQSSAGTDRPGKDISPY